MKHICSQPPSHRLTASQAATIVPSRTQQLPKAHTVPKATQDEPGQMLPFPTELTLQSASHRAALLFCSGQLRHWWLFAFPTEAGCPNSIWFKTLWGELVMCSVVVPCQSTSPLHYLGQDPLSPKAFLCIRIPHNCTPIPLQPPCKLLPVKRRICQHNWRFLGISAVNWRLSKLFLKHYKWQRSIISAPIISAFLCFSLQ